MEPTHGNNAGGPAVATTEPDPFLSFRIGTEEYAVDILKVQEIRGYTELTPIPHSPPHIKGVMNVRGMVVPVVGLRERFGMESVVYDKFTVILLLSLGQRVVGAIVDAVSDVLMVRAADIAPPPELGVEVDTSYLIGMAKSDGRLTLLVDIEKVMGDLGSAEEQPEGN
jgi:purine-binding chemotaxis protein CheW